MSAITIRTAMTLVTPEDTEKFFVEHFTRGKNTYQRANQIR